MCCSPDPAHARTIPATATITWGQTEKSIEYSVYSQLETGKGIKVIVRADSDKKMKNAANTAFLEYSLNIMTNLSIKQHYSYMKIHHLIVLLFVTLNYMNFLALLYHHP